MRYRRLDLNLLVALDALLSECSVSRAAERLHLGQSATSSALGRLREHFNDPLLVQVGRITSQLDPKDARRYTVRLTASGKELHDRVLKVALERESRLLSGLTPGEVDTLVDLLGRLHLQVPNVNSYDPSDE